jgi:hypothetical protein
MDFLLSHWHCIMPLAIIAIALLLMNKKKKDSGDEKK